MTLGESLERLDQLLPEREPEFWATLNPPAIESDLDVLRRVLDPYEPHDELVQLLRWHDGQRDDPSYTEGAWPLIECGPMLSALGAREAYQREDLWSELIELGWWSTSWVPLWMTRWSIGVVEMARPLGGLVLDASFGELRARPVAQSLSALMQAVCVIVEEGFPLRGAPGEGLTGKQWLEREDLVRPFHAVYSDGLARTAPILKDAGLP
ncbi:MAG TPA: hypothetical protein VH025_10765 [Solirubrobacteraceae bacterium]|jgi:hypothetical protein|nr:hypothetical protein [Solirubrobacteraceae bacterium]